MRGLLEGQSPCAIHDSLYSGLAGCPAIGRGGYKFYFLCDDRKLEREILQKCVFEHGDIPFIASMKWHLRRRAKFLYTSKRWRNAAYAHMTTFYHARRIGANRFWNIDADDTMLLMPGVKVSEAMRQVEKIVEDENLSAMSLDMWYSKTRGVDWTFGVTYINDNIDFCRIFESVRDYSWTEPFRDYEVRFNFDWYFTYMKHIGGYKIENFYVDRCYFLHGGDYLISPCSAWLCVWRDGQAYYPLADVLHVSEIREFPIVDSRRIDVGISEE